MDFVRSWSVAVPLKRPAIAKTRLHLPPGLRAELATAMALDTVAAAVACPVVAAVAVVTDANPAPFRRLGALVVVDQPNRGLNPALEHAAQVLARGRPTDGLAALAGDLPALRPEELGAVLSGVRPGQPVFVPDAAGSGTTLLAAPDGTPLVPQFGPGSGMRHRASGVADVAAIAGAGLRQDVDTLAELATATALGVGPHTTAVLSRTGLG